MSLTRSVALKPGTPIRITAERTGEIIMDYTVPDEYQALMHIVIDLFPKPTALVLPQPKRPGGATC